MLATVQRLEAELEPEEFLDDSTLINTYLKDLSRSTAGTALLASSEANETSNTNAL